MALTSEDIPDDKLREAMDFLWPLYYFVNNLVNDELAPAFQGKGNFDPQHEIAAHNYITVLKIIDEFKEWMEQFNEEPR